MKSIPTILLLAAIIGILAISGCSSSKKSGKTPGSGELSEYDLNAARENRFQGGAIPTAEGEGIFRDVHFAFDSAAIASEALQSLEYNAQVLKGRKNIKVQLEGHCDERGTAEYNLALGNQRARSVYNMLVSLGIPASQLDTISYGEEVPLEQGRNESAYARNRRVHFSAYSEQR